MKVRSLDSADRSRLSTPPRSLGRLGRICCALGLSAALAACKDKEEPPPPITNYDPMPAALGADFWSPFDAAPSPQADTIYFTALTPDGPAVLKVESQNGTPQRLHAGEPLVSPFGVMPDSSNTNVFVADSASEGTITEEDEESKIGRLFRISSTGGAPESLAGGEGTAPRSLDVVDENGRDAIYFTGRNPDSGLAAILKMGTDGANRQILFEGDPLVDPSGIAVASDGSIYVADVSGEQGVASAILRIQNGTATVLKSDLRVGYPAGVALTLDQKQLFVSGLKKDEGTAVVHIIDLATNAVTPFDKNIGQNMNSAGVHRAAKSDSFAWADSSGDEASPGGTVYFIPRR